MKYKDNWRIPHALRGKYAGMKPGAREQTRLYWILLVIALSCPAIAMLWLFCFSTTVCLIFCFYTTLCL